MLYFKTLPKILTTDANGNGIILTNILTRVAVIPELLKNTLAYYSYDIQEGDTPEIIASKYYGTVDNFWLVMMSNQSIDPQWDFPLNYINFTAFIEDKYGSAANAQSQIVRYEQTTTTTDLTNGGTPVVETIVIDETAYNNFIPSSTITIFSDGSQVSITTTAEEINAYDYEISLNESKRNINLLNVLYLNTIQSQFKNLIK
jgi:hypothetical protein